MHQFINNIGLIELGDLGAVAVRLADKSILYIR